MVQKQSLLVALPSELSKQLPCHGEQAKRRLGMEGADHLLALCISVADYLKWESTHLPSGHMTGFSLCSSAKATFWFWHPFLRHQGHWLQCKREQRSYFFFRDDHKRFPQQKLVWIICPGPIRKPQRKLCWSRLLIPKLPGPSFLEPETHLTWLCAVPASSKGPWPTTQHGSF